MADPSAQGPEPGDPYPRGRTTRTDEIDCLATLFFVTYKSCQRMNWHSWRIVGTNCYVWQPRIQFELGTNSVWCFTFCRHFHSKVGRLKAYPHQRLTFLPELNKRIAVETHGKSYTQFRTNSNSSLVWMGLETETDQSLNHIKLVFWRKKKLVRVSRDVETGISERQSELGSMCFEHKKKEREMTFLEDAIRRTDQKDMFLLGRKLQRNWASISAGHFLCHFPLIFISVSIFPSEIRPRETQYVLNISVSCSCHTNWSLVTHWKAQSISTSNFVEDSQHQKLRILGLLGWVTGSGGSDPLINSSNFWKQGGGGGKSQINEEQDILHFTMNHTSY